MDKKTFRQDLLSELFNISVGKAAAMLSEIVHKKILLRVPRLKILESKDDEIQPQAYLPQVMDGTLMVSSITFVEKLTGIANLIFPADKMRTFINLCVDEAANAKLGDTNFTDLDFDIIKEIGNIILNCVIGEIGNYLNINFDYTLPEVKVYKRIDFDRDISDLTYKSVLILYITFIIDNTEIEGAIIVDLTMNSIQELMQIIDQIEEELNE